MKVPAIWPGPDYEDVLPNKVERAKVKQGKHNNLIASVGEQLHSRQSGIRYPVSDIRVDEKGRVSFTVPPFKIVSLCVLFDDVLQGIHGGRANPDLQELPATIEGEVNGR